MALVKIQVPPGFRSQGTQVQAEGGWFTGNLVRWRQDYRRRWRAG
jgi:hypothetical protein